MHFCLMFLSISLVVKFCGGCLRQVFFSFGRQEKWSLVALDRCSSDTVTIGWKFAWTDSALVVLDEWPSYRGGRLNTFDCIYLQYEIC